MNERKFDINRDGLGILIFVLGVLPAVLLVVAMRKSDPIENMSGTGAIAAAWIATLGALPSLLFTIGVAYLGARLYLFAKNERLGRNVIGLAATALGASVLLGAFSPTAGGHIGDATGGLVSSMVHVALGAVVGLIALSAPIWFTWLRAEREPRIAVDPEHGAGAVLEDAIDDGVSAEEARALIPEEFNQAIDEGRKQLALKATTRTAPPPSPYPEDVRLKGQIPAGARPLSSEPNARTETSSEPEASSVYRWTAPRADVPDDGADEDLAVATELEATFHAEAAGATDAGEAGFEVHEPGAEEGNVDEFGAEFELSGATSALAETEESDAPAAPSAAASGTALDELPRPSWEQPTMFVEGDEPVDAYGTPLELVESLRHDGEAAATTEKAPRATTSASAAAEHDVDDDEAVELDGEVDAAELADETADDTELAGDEVDDDELDEEDELEADELDDEDELANEDHVDDEDAVAPAGPLEEAAHLDDDDGLDEEDELDEDDETEALDDEESLDEETDAGEEEDADELEVVATADRASDHGAADKEPLEVATRELAPHAASTQRELGELATADADVAERPVSRAAEILALARAEAASTRAAETETAATTRNVRGKESAPVDGPLVELIEQRTRDKSSDAPHIPSVATAAAENAVMPVASPSATTPSATMPSTATLKATTPIAGVPKTATPSAATPKATLPSATNSRASTADASRATSREPAGRTTKSPERELVLQPRAAPPEKTIKSQAALPERAELLREAGCLFVERGRVAVSMLQRQYAMDFDQACEVLDELQNLGLIGPYLGGQRRDILLTREQWLEKVGSV